MNVCVNDGRGLRRQYVEDSFNRDASVWEGRLVPTRWLRAYRKPIVILTNGFATNSIDPFRRSGEEELDPIRILLEDVREEIERQFEFVPDLPPPRFVAREGDVDDWRKWKGHLVACRCNGCGRVHPSYWLETERDVEIANEVERRHPAVTLLKRAIATFHGREFVGCYCLSWVERHPASTARRDWRRSTRWPAA